jgi:hypothetical protein
MELEPVVDHELSLSTVATTFGLLPNTPQPKSLTINPLFPCSIVA